LSIVSTLNPLSRAQCTRTF